MKIKKILFALITAFALSLAMPQSASAVPYGVYPEIVAQWVIDATDGSGGYYQVTLWSNGEVEIVKCSVINIKKTKQLIQKMGFDTDDTDFGEIDDLPDFPHHSFD